MNRGAFQLCSMFLCLNLCRQMYPNEIRCLPLWLARFTLSANFQPRRLLYLRISQI
ncbi:hypothetical protein M758_5G039500 [Ceratodon purpureus]|uniref:Uncharacterized protein n=1 Tax=Ceratodon purpureus TaxID=3225 RepID=A0A8T0HZS5_CERPU|nr:hypothetical protein KC19_5G039500 [Ceratodon purpureus]KAG0615416.1 hypothetical protein M758_5G039500 [Ceratodon purpureus]